MAINKKTKNELLASELLERKRRKKRGNKDDFKYCFFHRRYLEVEEILEITYSNS